MRTRDEQKEKLIRQKAIEIIVKEGLDGLGMNKVAKAAGVSPATLYIYFKDKEDFISTLCLEVSKKMVADSLVGFDANMNFETGLQVQWDNRLKYFMNNALEMEFMEIMRYTSYYEKVTQMLTETFGTVLGAFTKNAIAKGELLDLPFEVYWSIAFAPLYQLIKFHNQGKSYVNGTFSLEEDTIKQTLSLVLKALRP